LQIVFGSIFNIYHGTPILCCTTTDLGIFDTDFGIFGVAFVRALLIKTMEHCICTSDTQLRHFALVILLPTGRSRVSKKFSCRSQSKSSWPPLQYDTERHPVETWSLSQETTA